LKIEDLKVFAPPMEPLSRLLGIRGLRLLWRGLVATDLLIKAACERRPYEIDKGMTDLIHHQNLKDIENELDRESFGPALQRCADRLKSISIRKGQRPIVGIAGDIYTRQHPVANHNLYLKLEAMGCEVWPSPFLVDDVDFSLRQTFNAKVAKGRLHQAAAIGYLMLRKEVERWKVKKNLREALPRLREPSSKDILDFVSPYIGWDNNQTLLLNIAKMVDFAKRGADGVVNAICFNCMLGTVAEGLSVQIRKDYKNIPLPTLIYGTTDLASDQSKLEAFVYQVHQFAKKRSVSR
jgi:predicted nucleotide-binding protein (sugar kinase/HSP70/actin superfamily)